MVWNLQRLPVLIRDKAGLNQEAVDQSEHHRKQDNSGSQQTCGVQENHFILAETWFIL